MKITTLNKSLVLALSVVAGSAFAADTAPYNYKKSGKTPFKSALQEVKLTSPDGSKVLADGSSSKKSFNNYVTKNFRVPSGKNYMEIKHKGNKSTRTEFRHLTDFYLSDNNIMKGTIKVASTTSGLDEVTVLQIHNSDSSNIGAPLMRIAQIVENGKKFYEAKLRLSDCNKKSCNAKYDTYRWVDSKGKSTVTTTKDNSFYVQVKDDVVKMQMGGKRGTLMCEKSKKWSAANCKSSDKKNVTSSGDHKVKNWVNDGFFFKSGAYIQDKGTAVIQYKALSFDVVGA